MVGPARGSRHYGSDDGFFAGFYNRGLTLHTTRYPPRASLSHLQFKVDSPRLQHTLSRDDVRHDAAYHRVLERVAKIGEGVLRERIRTELEQAALDKDPRRYAALLSAAVWEPPQTIVLPLCDPLARAMVLSLTDVVVDGRILWSDKPSSLTAALAAAGIPVVHAVHAEVPLLIDGIVKATVARAGQVYVLAVERDDPTEHARAWTKLVGEALRVAGMEVGRVALCRLFDRGASPASRVVDQPGPRHTLLREGGERLGAWLQRDLLLDEGDPAVQAAFRLAGTSARESAALLARYILAESQGQVSAAQSDQLSAFAIGEAP
ncbi:MAG: hypothetical protein KC731_16940 [Myxococcales bacterium]|nr:hypothetical protein [Myxococcales bacterium]